MGEEKIRARIRALLEILPEPYRKKALSTFTKLLKTSSIVERRVYKGRIITFFCEGLKTSNRKNKTLCKELRMMLRKI